MQHANSVLQIGTFITLGADLLIAFVFNAVGDTSRLTDENLLAVVHFALFERLSVVAGHAGLLVDWSDAIQGLGFALVASCFVDVEVSVDAFASVREFLRSAVDCN